MDDPELLPNTDLHIQEILLAASQHDLATLQRFLRLYSFPDCESVDVQDPETGFTPLHAAIAACEALEDSKAGTRYPLVDAHHAAPGSGTVLSASDATRLPNELTLGGQETVRCLLQHGAIWNQLDKNDETAGCIAHRLGLKDLYEIMVDAGVRAELLLNRLEGYEELEDPDEVGTGENANDELNGASRPFAGPVLSNAPTDANADVSSAQYLSSSLSLGADKILDEQANGVMMSWESGIMSKSAKALLTAPDMKVLNVGFGMGIIDNFLQTHPNRPASHHIVEAHPAVLEHMKIKGWYDKVGVVVHEGRWQDILATLVIEGQMFNAIYFDTFAESYSDFRNFFAEQVIGLLDPAGKFSFFNGLGADRQISYDVYQKVIEIDLFEAGFDVDWQEVNVPELNSEWEGVKRKYWNVERYRLPTCRFMD